MEVVHNVPESKEVLLAAEKIAKNKAKTLVKQVKPLATHLLTNVTANTIVVKMNGGDQVIAAATAGALASVTSCVVEHQLGITQVIPKLAASSLSYTMAAMVLGERVSLPEAASLGLASSALAEIITYYV